MSNFHRHSIRWGHQDISPEILCGSNKISRWPASSPTDTLPLKLWIMAIISAPQTKKNQNLTFTGIPNIAETHFSRQRMHQVNVAVPLPHLAAYELPFTNRQRDNTCMSVCLVKFNLKASRQTFSLCLASKMWGEKSLQPVSYSLSQSKICLSSF